MNTLQIILLITTIWFLLGGISAWRMYWGEVKDYYIKYNVDKRLTIRQILSREKLYKVYLILLFYGVFSLILVEIFVETAWYYKIPKKEIEPKQTDFGKMAN
jgi:hypothetical protein